MQNNYFRMPKPDNMVLFGINLKHLAKEAKVDYKTVGKSVDRRPSTVQQWVAGRSQPDYNALVGLAEFFTLRLGRYVSIDEFFDRKEA